ncbi:MAG TPA: di-trans,poly-cis-decaprenylcistransferase [Gammaproteobacteria bacterium]|nr:di-trans,poly-cis-decaprenylcistransferase [Gammaproteobacteria bacterium]
MRDKVLNQGKLMHVAIIMDGNGRWAARRGLRRSAGHQAGARAVRRIVEAATQAQIDVLTLYAFSSDNWSRPANEVATLMRLLKRYLQSEVARCVENGVRLNVIGRRDRLSPDLVRIIERGESVTADGDNLTLQLAVDYSARDAIIRAAREAAGRCASREEFTELLAGAVHSSADTAGVDLLIRTGGERRLSDFLLWECAYAELVFVDEYWPDFDERALDAALAEFYRRERRFGGLPAAAAPSQRIGDAR